MALGCGLTSVRGNRGKNYKNELLVPQKHTKKKKKFNTVFSATTLSHASCFRRKRRVIENFEYLGEFEEYFRKWWLYCVLYLLVTESSKKKFKNRL
jgi:hypothetical protein